MDRKKGQDIRVRHEDGRLSYVHEQVFDIEGSPPRFVYSDVPYNEGPSMRNSTTVLAQKLHHDFGLQPKEIIFYERIEDDKYHKPDFEIVGGELRKYDRGKFYTKAEVINAVTQVKLYSPEEYKQQQFLGKYTQAEPATPWEHNATRVAPPKLSMEETLQIHTEVEKQKKQQR